MRSSLGFSKNRSTLMQMLLIGAVFLLGALIAQFTFTSKVHAQSCGLTAPTNVQVNDNTITWNPVAGAATYDVRIDKDTFSGWWGDCGGPGSKDPDDHCKSGLTTTSYSGYTFVPGQSYGVWVYAITSTGCVGPETHIPYPTRACVTSLGTVNDLRIDTQGTEVQWTGVPNAWGYNLTVDDKSNPAPSTDCLTTYPGDLCRRGHRGINYPYKFVDGKSYRVSINAEDLSCSVNGIGLEGPTSEINFTFTAPPACITSLPSPSTLTVNQATNLISWSPVSGADHYILRIDDVANDFYNNCANTNSGDGCIDNINGTSYSAFPFVAGHTYRVWVHAVVTSCGTTIVSQPPKSVPVPSSISCPAGLTQPADLKVTNNTTVSWGTVANSTHYNIRIDDTTNPWKGSTTGDCYAPNAGDKCDRIATTSYTYVGGFVVGRTYRIWVDATQAACGVNSITTGPITYVGATPTNTPTPTTAILTPTITPTLAPGCPRKPEGDANCDGQVNIVDFGIWSNEFSGLSTLKTADFNSSAVVDIVDFGIWSNTFRAENPAQQVTGSGPSTSGGASATQDLLRDNATYVGYIQLNMNSCTNFSTPLSEATVSLLGVNTTHTNVVYSDDKTGNLKVGSFSINDFITRDIRIGPVDLTNLFNPNATIQVNLIKGAVTKTKSISVPSALQAGNLKAFNYCSNSNGCGSSVPQDITDKKHIALEFDPCL